MGKSPVLNFGIVMTWRGIRAKKDSDSWCGVFNPDRNQIKSR